MLTLRRIAHDSHLHAVFGVASDISGDGTFVFIDNAPHQCIVFALGGLVVELQSQAGLCIGSLSHNQQSRGILVDTVNQSHLRVVWIVGRYVTQMPGNGIHQRAMIISAPRMYYQSCGLVDDHQIIILVNNVQRNIFGNNIVVVAWTVHHDGQHVERLYLVAAFYRLAVCHDKPCVGRRLNTVARSVDDAFEQILVDAHRCLSFIYYYTEMFV